MVAKPVAAHTYISIFNSFRVIRCLSQCVSPKIAILPHFCFRWGRPWGNHAKCCMDGKGIRCLQIVSQHVPIYIQQFPSYSNRKCKKSPTFLFPLRLSKVQKIAVFTYCSPHFCFSWRRPCDYHAICCMDGKTIQCLSNPSQQVPIYLQQFPSYSNRKCKNRSFHVPQPTFLFPLETPLRLSCNVLHGW